MQTAAGVVKADLESICNRLEAEFLRLKGKRLLIVGGAGFLGYYLVQSLLYWNKKSGLDPIRVTVYDNYIRGIPQWLQSSKDDPDLSLIRQDITRPLPADIGDFQYIIHAASIASPTYYRKFPIETMDANVNGLRILLEYCKRRKQDSRPIEGFLFYSTSEIYGDPDPAHIPTAETFRGYVSCTGPRACYDESKRYGETLCVNFSQQYGLPVKIARPFNNYGPGLKITDRRVLPDFVRDVFAGRDIILLSDGSPTRTFCYIADAIVGYYKILILGRPGQAYNIGADKPEISMSVLANKITELAGELFGYSGKVVCGQSKDHAYLVDNPQRRCPDIAKARSELAYNPQISVEEGLRRSLIWYSENCIADEA